MCTNDDDQARITRWKRRLSDGAAWNSSSESFSSDNEDSAERRVSAPFPFLRVFANWIAPFGEFSHEPIQITDEFRSRISSAARASLASLVTFALLVLTGQDVLPASWIGNVLALSTLKPTLGATLLAVKDVFVPLVPCAVISWGVSILLDLLNTAAYQILLPPIVMLGGMIILLCPWPYLTMKNLMLVVFYLIVSSPLSLRYIGGADKAALELVQEPLGPWFVPGLVGTCSVGLSVALLVHLMLARAPKSTTAIRSIPKTMNQLRCETYQLLVSVSEYIQATGKSSSKVRRARASIDFFVASRQRTLLKLEEYLPAIKAERCLAEALCMTLPIETVEEMVKCAKKQQKHADLIRLATTQLLMGEEFTSRNETVRDVKTKMSDHLGSAVEQLASEYASAEGIYCRGPNRDAEHSEDAYEALQAGMDSYRIAMKRAIIDAEFLLLGGDGIDFNSASRSVTGPLIRSRVVFHAVYSFASELCEMIEERDKEESRDDPPMTLKSKLKATVQMPWLWNDIGKRRLALKTAVGLGLASLWVSIPQLREDIANPNCIWVGVTLASVNLESTGAAYIKCIDRLWGTLVAAAYALLIGKVFAPTNDVAKIVSVAVFTLVATFLTNLDVDDYVPGRIMLIFIGVAIFLFVELLVLPRSSRTIVQANSIQFFEDLEHFLFEASKVAGSISSFHKGSSIEDDFLIPVLNDPLWMLRTGHEKMAKYTINLTNAEDTVKETITQAKGELDPGISEPSLGLNVALDASGYQNLFLEQSRCHAQLGLLITTIKSLIGYHSCLSKESAVRSLHWPSLLSASLVQVAQQLGECADKLREVFPHGLCRPGACDVSSIIRALAIFRDFEDVRLAILGDWADRHAAYLNLVKTSGEEVRYTPGFRLTLALAASSILTIGRSLQNCGIQLEKIAQAFPTEEIDIRKLREGAQLSTATIRMGDYE